MKLFNITQEKLSTKYGTPTLILNGQKRVFIPFEISEDLNADNFKVVMDQMGPKVINSNYKDPNEYNYITRINCKGNFRIGNYGTAYVLSETSENVRIITYGYELCEDIERNYGLYFDWLIAVKAPAVIYVKACGHSSKIGDTYFIIFNENNVEKVYVKSIEKYKSINKLQFSTNIKDYVDFGTLKQPQLY